MICFICCEYVSVSIPWYSCFVAFGVELHGLTQVSRQISSERMRNGIGTLKVTATGAGEPCDKRIPRSDEVTSSDIKCLTSDLVQTFIFQEAQLEETFPAWVNNFNSSTLWILANEMLLFCSGAGRASKRRLLEMGLWLIYFLPKLISCLSNFLIEFWAWGGCPQGRLLCFWWYR